MELETKIGEVQGTEGNFILVDYNDDPGYNETGTLDDIKGWIENWFSPQDFDLDIPDDFKGDYDQETQRLYEEFCEKVEGWSVKEVEDWANWNDKALFLFTSEEDLVKQATGTDFSEGVALYVG